MRGQKIELDQLLSDPSIRDSLRSDGYYKRHQQKPHRIETVKEKDPKNTLFKNIPLGFVKNLSPQSQFTNVAKVGLPSSNTETASMRLQAQIKNRSIKQKQTSNVPSVYSVLSPNSTTSYNTLNSASNSVNKKQFSATSNSISSSNHGSFNSTQNAKQNPENPLNSKFSVNSNFLNKLKLKNLSSIASKLPDSQTSAKRGLAYQTSAIPITQTKLAKNTSNSNPHLVHLTLSSNQQGSNVVQINNYLNAGSKPKDASNTIVSKSGIGQSVIHQKGPQTRSTQINDVIRKTGFRNVSNLRPYNDVLLDIDQSSKQSASLSNKSGSKRLAPKWKATFSNLNNQFS